MINKYFNYIVIVLLLILFCQGLFSVPKGISEEEHLLMVRLHDLNQENILLIKKNNQYESNILKLKNEILENNNFVDSASNEQIDSLFADYFSDRKL